MGGSNNRGRKSLYRICTALAILTIVTILAFAGGGASAQEASQEPQQVSPPLRVKVDRVNVGVVVTDGKGEFVQGLRRDDFQVLDDGSEQPLTSFLSTDDPAQILLMVECGPAVYFFRKDLIFASEALLSNLAPSDRVAVVCYSRQPQLALDFTEDKNAARTALAALDFNLGYADLNLSSSVLAVLDWLKSIPGKKSIVLVTTGVDTSPASGVDELHNKLAASDVRVMAISTAAEVERPSKQKKKIAAEQSDARASVREVLGQADQALRGMAEFTGGRVYTPVTPKEFERAYADVAQFARHEYDLEFAPPVRDGKLHTIEVRVKQQNYTISCRHSYLAPSDAD